MVEHISDTLTIIDEDGRLVATTGQLKPILGYPPEYWEHRSLFDLAHPDELEHGAEVLERIRTSPLGTEMSAEFRMRHADGHWEVVDVTGVNLLEDPDVGGIVITSRNITARRRAETLLASQARALERIARSAPLHDSLAAVVQVVEDQRDDAACAAFVFDDGRFAMAATGGLPPEVAVSLDALASDDVWALATRLSAGEELALPDLVTSSLPGAALLGEAGFVAASVVPVVQTGRLEVTGILLVALREPRLPNEAERHAIETASGLAAIAIERDQVEASLAHQAGHDALTGLPNRTSLLKRLRAALEGLAPRRQAVAVLFLDVDRFKVVNDSLGHGVGDELLVVFAERLSHAVRPGDLVARFGGDEFVVVLDEVVDAAEARAVAERVEQVVQAPFVLGDDEVVLTSSIGIALGHAGRDLPDAVLRNADTAMYRAKDLGRNRIVLFDEDLRERAVSRLLFENDLRRAIAADQLVVHYQPSFDLATGVVNGVEALVRWDHPRRDEPILPDDFLPVAAETGLLAPLGMQVLERAVADAARWAEDDPAFGRLLLAVNVSAHQITDPALVDRVGEVLQDHGWPAGRLALELTETELLADEEATLAALRSLSAAGVQLCVDDFGTGYSSLSYLHRFPMDIVKIDRSFVASIGHEASGVAIANGVVGMAHALGQIAVAEGIETDEQLEALRTLGCDWGQGFLFGVPMPADEVQRRVHGALHPPG